MPFRALLTIDIALKIALVVVLGLAVAFPESAQFAGKAMGARALTYNSVDWSDDLNHLVNWAFLSAAAGFALGPLRLHWLNQAGLVTGFGAVTAIIWELLEYVAFIRDSPELATAYTDTLGDLGLGLTGSVLSALAVATLMRRRPGTRPATTATG